MKFKIQCWVGSTLAEVSNHRLFFSQNAPASAQLTVKATPKIGQIIAVELGWGDSLRRVFTGIVERTAPDNSGFITMYCRELACALFYPLNVVLRNPTMLQVLNDIAQKTGLQFVTPNAKYINEHVPCFYAVGNGYHALDQVGSAFGIDGFIWQQQGDGKIYAGGWADSYWATKGVSVPDNLLNQHEGMRTATIPCTPHFKPFTLVNGRKLATVEHKNQETVITWT